MILKMVSVEATYRHRDEWRTSIDTVYWNLREVSLFPENLETNTQQAHQQASFVTDDWLEYLILRNVVKTCAPLPFHVYEYDSRGYGRVSCCSIWFLIQDFPNWINNQDARCIIEISCPNALICRYKPFVTDQDSCINKVTAVLSQRCESPRFPCWRFVTLQDGIKTYTILWCRSDFPTASWYFQDLLYSTELLLANRVFPPKKTDSPDRRLFFSAQTNRVYGHGHGHGSGSRSRKLLLVDCGFLSFYLWNKTEYSRSHPVVSHLNWLWPFQLDSLTAWTRNCASCAFCAWEVIFRDPGLLLRVHRSQYCAYNYSLKPLSGYDEVKTCTEWIGPRLRKMNPPRIERIERIGTPGGPRSGTSVFRPCPATVTLTLTLTITVEQQS